MNQNNCNELRDLLFAARFPAGAKEDIFRFMAVMPGGNAHADAAATVHYAYSQAAWERADETNEAGSVLVRLLANTPYAAEDIALQYHDYLRDGWNLSWGLTAKASHNNFPTLVLQELANGKVTGVWMSNANIGGSPQKIVEDFAELDEVARIIGDLRDLPLHAQYMRWYKESNIDAATLDEALASIPETDPGQKGLWIYREGEWLSGLWNNPEKLHSSGGVHLSSVADFHGTRVSEAKRKTRVGLDVVRQNTTLPGDSDVLKAALERLRPHHLKTCATTFEYSPAVELLCGWWNANAPDEMRYAALFRAYTWSERDQIFAPGDPEEPALQAELLAEEGSYALFEQEGRPPIALQFHRGRRFNTKSNGGTQTYMANGKEGMDIGMDIDDVDEAYYAVKGLLSVQRDWARS